MQLVDTHAHLDDAQFDGQHSGVVERASAAGVTQIITIGTTASSSVRCVELATKYEAVFAAVGIQPNYTAEVVPRDWARITDLAGQPKVVAVGETGLDHFWDFTPLDVQQQYFEQHLRLAQDLGLPCVIHMREPQATGGDSPSACGEHIWRVLQAATSRPLRGVMHSFTGNEAVAEKFLDWGLHISFAGMVTYKKSVELRRVVEMIPAGRLLVETDAPYLAPHPKRGQRPNEPALIVHTAECLAAVRGLSLTDLAELTTCNAQALFELP